LHHSDRLAAAAWMAGIPDRRGYGWGRQRWFLNTGPFLPHETKKQHQHTRATQYLQCAGIPLPSAEPQLIVPPATLAEAMQRLNDPSGESDTPAGSIAPGRFVAIGIGSSEMLRQWGTERFGALAQALLDVGWPMLVLIGGREDLTVATTILKTLGNRSQQVRLALGWKLTDVMGVLSQAAFYVGNNTGAMNMAAAIGTRTYALFGTTRPFDHASQIVPIIAPDLGIHDGMQRLTLTMVLNAIQADRGRLTP
jgi:heptosyltransferase-2